MASAIQQHNERAAATWGAGGTDYDAISRTIADSIEHCVHRLAPGPGERVLPTRVIQAWLGHADIRHTVRYTELSSVPFKDVWRGIFYAVDSNRCAIL